MIKPQSQWSKTGFLPGQNLLLQMYYQSLLETERDDDARGVETFDQWLQRGPLYCWRFERYSHNLATDVQTRVTYDPVGAGLVWPTDGGCNLFLVSEYRRQTEITRKDDQITNVVSLNI